MLLAREKAWLLFTGCTSGVSPPTGQCGSDSLNRPSAIRSTAKSANLVLRGTDWRLTDCRPAFYHFATAHQRVEKSAAMGAPTTRAVRRDWEDPAVVNWNTRRAHVPLHSHPSIEGTAICLNIGTLG